MSLLDLVFLTVFLLVRQFFLVGGLHAGRPPPFLSASLIPFKSLSMAVMMCCVQVYTRCESLQSQPAHGAGRGAQGWSDERMEDADLDDASGSSQDNTVPLSHTSAVQSSAQPHCIVLITTEQCIAASVKIPCWLLESRPVLSVEFMQAVSRESIL